MCFMYSVRFQGNERNWFCDLFAHNVKGTGHTHIEYSVSLSLTLHGFVVHAMRIAVACHKTQNDYETKIQLHLLHSVYPFFILFDFTSQPAPGPGLSFDIHEKEKMKNK